MAQFTIDQIAATGWQTVLSYTPNGGNILVVRQISAQIINTPGSVDDANKLYPWRVVIDNSPVDGMDNIYIGLGEGAPVNCFLLVASNRTIKIQREIDSGSSGSGGNWQVRLYANLLTTQNVTLPWEPCNVE